MDYQAMSEALYNHAKDVIDNGSPYDIERQTGVAHSKIYRIRRGELKIINLSFDTINRLAQYKRTN